MSSLMLLSLAMMMPMRKINQKTLLIDSPSNDIYLLKA